MNKKKMLHQAVGFVVAAVIGFLVIFPLMKKYSNWIYKSFAKREKIDFENMGPEIVKNNNTKGE